jgi:hypothetical protein
MTKGELKAALAEAERVRDEWCAEYVKARDALCRANSRRQLYALIDKAKRVEAKR